MLLLTSSAVLADDSGADAVGSGVARAVAVGQISAPPSPVRQSQYDELIEQELGVPDDLLLAPEPLTDGFVGFGGL